MNESKTPLTRSYSNSHSAEAIFALLQVERKRRYTIQWMPADFPPGTTALERFEIIRVADGEEEAHVLIHDDGSLELLELVDDVRAYHRHSEVPPQTGVAHG